MLKMASRRQGQAEKEALNSLSSFSSLSSEDTPTLKYKLEKEKEKTRKYEDRLSGYETIGKQFLKLQEANKILKQKVEEQSTHIQHLQNSLSARDSSVPCSIPSPESTKDISEAAHTELPADLRPQGTGSACTTGSSQSFVVIGQSARSSPLPVSSFPNPPMNPPSPDKTSTPQPAIAPEQAVYTLSNETFSNQPQQPHHYQQQQQQLQQQQIQQQQQYQTVLPMQRQQSEILVSTASQDHSVVFNSSPIFTTYTETSTLQPRAVAGSAVSAVGNGKKPNMQSEYEVLMRRNEFLTQIGTTLGSPYASPLAATFTEASDLNDLSQPLMKPALAVPEWGFGARPKQWQPLNISEQTDLKRAADICATGSRHNGPSDPASGIVEQRNSPPSQTRDIVKPQPGQGEAFSTFKRDTELKALGSLNDSSAGKDLMTFPSLNTNPSPEEVPEQNRKQETGGSMVPLFSLQKHQTLATPSDEQAPLASQAQSMAAIIQTNEGKSLMSEKMLQFAEDALNMERKLNESQALIQKYQVQLQSYAKQNYEEEIQMLRDENQTIMEMLTSKASSPDKPLVEGGWVNVEKPGLPSQAAYPDSPYMKRIEQLEKISAKLFVANKDWHDKWEGIRQETQLQKKELEARVAALMLEAQQADQKRFEAVEEAKVKVQEAKASAQEAVQRATELERQLSEERSLVNSLKIDLGNMAHEKRKLETELTALKGSSLQNKQDRKAKHDLETENTILKQQVSYFMEDFNKERKDKTVAESKVEKLRRDREQIKRSMDHKLRTAQAMLKTREADLELKVKQNADLHYQLDDMKRRFQAEQKKSSSYPHRESEPISTVIENSSSMLYPSGGHSFIPFSQSTSQPHPPQASYVSHASEPSRSVAPEHLPGAWQCKDCTYINYPDRTVCDICGLQNPPDRERQYPSVSGKPELKSRGQDHAFRGVDVPDKSDVEVDGDSQLQ